MIHPAFIDTPFFEHSTSVPGTVPRPLRPVYRPEVVAEAVLEVARRPRPEVAVGGSAAAFTVLGTVARPLLELILSTYGVRWQRTDLRRPSRACCGRRRGVGMRTGAGAGGEACGRRFACATHILRLQANMSDETPHRRAPRRRGRASSRLPGGRGGLPAGGAPRRGDSAASWRPVLPQLARSRRVYASRACLATATATSRGPTTHRVLRPLPRRLPGRDRG